MRFNVVLALSIAACAEPNVDVAAERELVLETDRAFARATAERGVDGWLAYHLPDAANVPDQGPIVRGHEAIGARMTPLLTNEGVSFAWEPLYAEVAEGGRMAYSFGDWTIRIAATDSVQYRGRYLTVWTKQADGRWMVTSDIGNTVADGN